MKGKDLIKDNLYQELEFAKEALFASRTLKEAKFWQEKIRYLESLIKKNNINRKKQ